jgi:uncharacterized membrane protein YbhN (UPF0104 family)
LPSRYRLLGRWLLAAVLLALAIRLVLSDPELGRRLLATPLWVVLSVGALVTINQVLMSLRLALSVESAGGPRIPELVWFRLTSVGQFLNLFGPLGNVYRAVVLKRDHGLSYTAYASALFAFVWLDTLMAFLIALLVIAVLEPGLHFFGYPALVVLSLVIVATALAPVVALRAVTRFGTLVPARLAERLVKLFATAGGALRRPRFVVRFLVLNLITTVVHTSVLWLGVFAVGGHVGLSGLVLFQVFVRASNVIQITPGNVGINEFAYGLLAHASHSSVELGVSVALLNRTIGTLTTIIVGVAFGGGALLFERRSLRAANEALADDADAVSDGTSPK